VLYRKYAEHKSFKQIADETSKGETCSIPGCNKPLTPFKGPGQDVYCLNHQLEQKEFGGMGSSRNSLHTFHRKRYCEDCGYNPFEDPKYDQYKNDLELYNRLCRSQLIGDHNLVREADGGEDVKENIKTLCLRCNADKTIINKDYLPSRKER
jgi:HNH endonuclease